MPDFPENSTTNQAPPPLAGKLMRGVAWTISMRWGMRGLGLISTIFLARLLTPADFGLVAIAMAVVAFADTLIDFGVDVALLRDKHAGRDQFDTAWTVRQIQFAAVSGVIFLVAPLAADYFGDPRLSGVMMVIALSILLRGPQNIGIIKFRKDLMFHRDFNYNVAVRVLGTATTIGLAFYLRSYWALVIAMVAANLIGIVLSYMMSPYRPRYSIAAWRELWGFSQWILVGGIATYFHRKLDILFLGRVSTADVLGQYTVASEISELPTTEISMPISRALFPGFAQLIDEPERMKSAFLKSLGAVATLALPAGLGLALVAPELVPILLGDQWYGAIPILQIFSIFGAFSTLAGITRNFLIVLGYLKYQTVLDWLRAILFLIVIFPAFSAGGVIAVAGSKVAVSGVALMAGIALIVRFTEIRVAEVLGVLSRPVLASVLMAAGVWSVDQLYQQTGASALQVSMIVGIKVAVGVVIYSVLILAGWKISGCPEGLETEVVRILRQSRSKLAAR